MSKFSLLFALLFVGGQKLANSRRMAATLRFHKDDVLIIHKYVPGKCETLDFSLRSKVTYVSIEDENIRMTLYDQPMCDGETIHLDKKNHGDLEKLGFGNKAVSYKIFDGTESPPQQPDVTLYAEMDYGGESKAIAFGSNQCSNLPATFNATNSVKVSKSVMLCKEANCQGEKLEVKSDMESIDDAYVKIKSVMQLPLPYTATLFEDINYSGKQCNVTVEWEGLCTDICKDFINKTSSVIVTDEVQLYTAKGCKGASLDVFFNLPDVGKLQHRIASIKRYSHSRAHIALYSKENLEGLEYLVNFEGDSSCVNLEYAFQNKTKSVRTFNRYMLCSEKDCRGRKMVVRYKVDKLGDMSGKVMSIARLPLPQPAILFEGEDYSGNHFNITFPRDTSCENLPDHFIDKASSALTSLPVKLFSKKNCEGNHEEVKDEVSHLVGLNKKSRSIQKVIPAAIIYERHNYLGKMAYITFPNNTKCENMKKFRLSDTILSMIAYKNVTLYTQADCKGVNHTLVHNVYPDFYEYFSKGKGINNNIQAVGIPENQ